MVASIVRQLTKGLSAEELEEAGFAPYYVDHTAGILPQAAGGIPFNACEFQSKGDAITDLFEDMAAEQKAHDLRQYFASGQGSGGLRPDPLFTSAGDCSLPALRRGTSDDSGRSRPQ